MENLQAFLEDIAENGKPDFQPLLRGIAEYFAKYGTLSEKQRKLVRTSASIQQKECPLELDIVKTERERTDIERHQSEFFNVTDVSPINSDHDIHMMLANMLTKIATAIDLVSILLRR